MKPNLTKLEELLNQVASREEVEALLRPVKEMSSQRRYGLVWEEPESGAYASEGADTVLKNHFPFLKEDVNKALVLEKEKAQDNPTNLLIEGDNLHALQAMQYTHKGKVDVIYIDPPYNTGNQDFVYNDRFVDKEDSWRHSSWLSFMNKRLRLARELMSDEGVIFISIDDNEMAQLKLLCDQVFGEENFVNSLIWYYNNSTMKNPTNRLASSHEYILVYSKTSMFKINQLRHGEVSEKLLNRFGRYADENLNIRLKDVRNEKSYLSRMIPKFKKENGRFPCDEDIIDTLEPNWLRSVIEMPTTRSNELNKFGIDFNNPKNVKLIMLLLRLHPNPNALVLDFFAGSGTTGHAVMELNKEDGGNRQFILCTNNEINADKETDFLVNAGHITAPPKSKRGKAYTEWKETVDAFKASDTGQVVMESDAYKDLGIARAVTYERLKRVINGYTTPKGKDVEGIPNTLRYFTVTLKEDTEDDELNSYRLIKDTVDLIRLKENVYTQVNTHTVDEVPVVHIEDEEKIIFIVLDTDVYDEQIERILELYPQDGRERVLYSSYTHYPYNNLRFENLPKEILRALKAHSKQ